MSSSVEVYEDPDIRGHRFRGAIYSRDLMMSPQEVVERVKGELIRQIADRVMAELGPRLDEAIVNAWQEPS